MKFSRVVRRYRGWLAVGALAAVAGTAYLVLQDGGEPASQVSYQTEAATKSTVSSTVSGTGALEVADTTDVYAGTSGTVAAIAVAEGSTVTTGAALFTLDAGAAESAKAQALVSLRQAQQGVTQAELQVTRATNALETARARSTVPTPTVSAADIEAAAGDVEVAEAQLATARAQLASADSNYDDAAAARDDLTVTSPCSGQVYSLNVAVGDSVTSGTGSASAATGGGSATAGGITATTASASGAPVVIAPEQPLVAHLTINEVDLPTLEVGQRADISFDAFTDITATGKINEIAEEGTNSSGVVTFDVYLTLDMADPRLRAGMSVAATVVTEIATNVLAVPNAAVHSDGSGGYYVLTLAKGATEPVNIAVETGLASDSQTVILAGVTEGDLVVTQTVDAGDDSESTTGGSGGLINMGGAGRVMGGTPPTGGPMGDQ